MLDIDDAIRRRRQRFAVIVAIASGLVAVGVTGVGLLLPGGAPTPVLRLGAVVVAIAAGGALLRLEGPARAATTLAMVATTGAVICLLTFPTSPVTLSIGPDTLPFTPPGTIDEGSGLPGDDSVVLGPGLPQPSTSGVMSVPEGFAIVVQDGFALAIAPGGGTTVLGATFGDGSLGGVGAAGTELVPQPDGTVTRGDGGPLGAGVPLGGVTFERADGSRVTLGTSDLLDVPSEIETDEPEPTEDLDALVALLLAAFALLAFAPPIVRFGDRIAVTLVDPVEDEDEVDEVVVVALASMEEGLSDVLASMLADPDPRTSVIGAYARLLDALAAAGFPREPHEGPHEHLWRILGPLGVRRQPVHQLAELFVRARFTPKPVTAAHRLSAINALADAIADLRLQDQDIDDDDIRELVAQVAAV